MVLDFAMQELRRRNWLFGRMFALIFAERLVAEKAVPTETIVAEEAGSGKAAGFAEGIQCTVAVVAGLGSFAAVLSL